jgi:hypothetical protein
MTIGDWVSADVRVRTGAAAWIRDPTKRGVYREKAVRHGSAIRSGASICGRCFSDGRPSQELVFIRRSRCELRRIDDGLRSSAFQDVCRLDEVSCSDFIVAIVQFAPN